MPTASERKVTIHAIAKDTGYSLSTISSALTNQHVKRGISLEAVERIFESSRKLGYLPNMAARRLRAPTSMKRQLIIAVMTSFEAPLPLTSYAVNSLQRLTDDGTSPDVAFTIAIEMFHAGRLKEVPGMSSADYFHGAILTNTAPADDDFLRRTYLPFPVVLVNRVIEGYSSVREDPEAGAQAAEILIRQGSRRPALLQPSILTQSTQCRVNAFYRCVTRLLGRAPEPLVCEGLSEEAGCTALQRALQKGSRFDALYCVTDSLAFGAYHALKGKRRSIPRHVSIVGVGDSENCRFYDPPLTCVGVPHQRLHNEAAAILVQRLKTRTNNLVQKSLEPVVCLRQSTKAIKPRSPLKTQDSQVILT